ncbi:MAG TPA: response regulator transcription factor, partial [Thermodesulfobacteriota bacterium]|nr:response regulator transcription factor [Thermodesulfobacteriota bacterium]
MEDLAYKPVGVAYAMKEKKRMRIVIAEDHAIVRKGLRTLLSKDPEMVVVGEASDGREAIQCTERFKPDLLLIDLSMPKMDGTTAIRELKRRNQKTKVLVLTMHKTEDNVLAALQAGADGYLLKDDTPS